MTMTATDKSTWASIFAECPAWCDGDEHLNGDAAHIGTVGSVEHVSVYVKAQPGQEPGVVITADDAYGWDHPMTPAQVQEVAALIQRASATVNAD